MIWTSSGCAVSVSPRTNSRTDRALRLTVVALSRGSAKYNIRRATAAGRSRRMRSPTLSEPSKIDPTGMKPKRWWRATAARPADAMQPQLLQSGAPPNWHGVIFVVRSAEIGRRRAREDALVGRVGRRRRRPRAALRASAASDSAAAAPCRSATTRSRSIGREPLVGHLADLRRVQAHPDLVDFRLRRPELQELFEIARAVRPAGASPCSAP